LQPVVSCKQLAQIFTGGSATLLMACIEESGIPLGILQEISHTQHEAYC